MNDYSVEDLYTKAFKSSSLASVEYYALLEPLKLSHAHAETEPPSRNESRIKKIALP